MLCAEDKADCLTQLTLNSNNKLRENRNALNVSNVLNESATKRQAAKSQQLIGGRDNQNANPKLSSRFILNSNTNFNSLRIEDPKRANDEPNDAYVKLMLNSIPVISRHFRVSDKLGEGTFSKVFKARSVRDSSKEFALKYIIPTIKPSRIATEVRYLRDLGGTDNIIALKTCLYANGHAVIVMPMFSHQKFSDYVALMSADEVRHYMQNLLMALQKVHSCRIIHRDIKPANFLYDRKTRRYALVDFGLAQNEKELMMPVLRRQSSDRLNDTNVKFASNARTNAKLKRNSFNDLNAASNQILAPNDMKWQIKKRSRSEALLKERPDQTFTPKKPKPVRKLTPICSIFNSPITPSEFKLPDNLLTENLFTPKKNVLSVIPETPPKTTRIMNMTDNDIDIANNGRALNEINETPKTRYRKAPKKAKRSPKDVKCDCLGANQVCGVCKCKPDLMAPRAGTPGFRAPEVLMKYFQQTTLIDIWSAGVIFACLLSGRYPFFRNIDDMTSLAEIITVLGSKRVQKAANALDKTFTVSSNHAPMNLQLLCQQLRGENHSFRAPDSAFDLLDKLLEPNPKTRISASEALKHQYFRINDN